MSTENINTATVQTATPAEHTGGQKTFDQDQVNAIVQERLARDREKQSEELSKKEQELLQREFRLDSRQKLIDRGHPEDILDALNCSSKEAFDKALDVIDRLIKERTPSPEEKADMEARIKAAASAPKFTDRSEPRQSGMDMIRKAMDLQ